MTERKAVTRAELADDDCADDGGPRPAWQLPRSSERYR